MDRRFLANRIGPIKRGVWIAGCVVFVAICLGCMSIGGRTEIVNRDDRASSQTGKANVPGGQQLDVYYPVPYATPPNLEIADEFVIVEQKADHFRVKNTSTFSRTVNWTARGVPIVIPGQPAVIAVEKASGTN